MMELLRLKWKHEIIYREELNAFRDKDILHSVPDSLWGTGLSGKKGRNNFGL